MIGDHPVHLWEKLRPFLAWTSSLNDPWNPRRVVWSPYAREGARLTLEQFIDYYYGEAMGDDCFLWAGDIERIRSQGGRIDQTTIGYLIEYMNGPRRTLSLPPNTPPHLEAAFRKRHFCAGVCRPTWCTASPEKALFVSQALSLTIRPGSWGESLETILEQNSQPFPA